ncbi:MAG: dihydrofolate reductase [Rhodocyclaceae bacterium]
MRAVSLIAAVARNGIIGAGNRLPWRLPEDLARFKALTWGHPVIMGRRTWESLGRALPGRPNLVVSRSERFRAEGARSFPSLEAALEACGDEPAFVIGGAHLYAAALPLAQRMYLTEIDADFDGDASFPAFDRSEWIERSREPRRTASGLAFAFVLYERRRPPPGA